MTAASLTPSGVDPETGEIVERTIVPPEHIRLRDEQMTETEALKVVKDIKFYGVRMAQLVMDAWLGKAHKALGFETWADFCHDRLGVSRSRADQLVQHCKKVDALAEVAELAADAIDIPEWQTRRMDLNAALDLLGKAVRELPPDASITTRGDLIKAISARLTAEAKQAEMSTAVDKQNTTKGGGDDGSDTAGDAASSGDGANSHDVGQSDPEPPPAVSSTPPVDDATGEGVGNVLAHGADPAPVAESASDDAADAVSDASNNAPAASIGEPEREASFDHAAPVPVPDADSPACAPDHAAGLGSPSPVPAPQPHALAGIRVMVAELRAEVVAEQDAITDANTVDNWDHGRMAGKVAAFDAVLRLLDGAA